MLAYTTQFFVMKKKTFTSERARTRKMVSDFIVIYVARYDMLPPGIGSK
jgi:hypothetical protein